MAAKRRAKSARQKRDNARARAAGFRNYYEFRKIKKDPVYKRWVKAAAEKEGKSETEFRKLSNPLNTEYRKAFYTKKGTPRKTHKRDYSKGGLLDRALVRAGLRSADYWWAVGETDRVVKQFGSIEAAIDAEPIDNL